LTVDQEFSFKMAANVTVCNLDPDLEKQLEKFRFRRDTSNHAIVMKVDRDSQTVVCDEMLEDLDNIEELRDTLPEHQPRYVVYTSKLVNSDGRVSYPMCFIFSSPKGCKPEMNMMYAGSKLALVTKIGLQHVFEVRELEELTEEWLAGKLVRG